MKTRSLLTRLKEVLFIVFCVFPLTLLFMACAFFLGGLTSAKDILIDGIRYGKEIWSL